MAITRARYDVRNNIKQFLRVALPEDAEVWSAEVGGKVVKPARDGEKGAVLIPLFKSVETGRVLDTFPVELVYMESAPKSPVLYGKHALNAPATDILANEIAWQVLVPETQRVFRTSGDLKPAREVPVGARSTLDRGQTSVSQETIYRLREGIERFYIKDINNPAASAVAGEPRYQGQQLQEGAPAETEIAGVLPVRIDLPTEGVSYLFRGSWPGRQELHLTSMCTTALRPPATGRCSSAAGPWRSASDGLRCSTRAGNGFAADRSFSSRSHCLPSWRAGSRSVSLPGAWSSGPLS